MFYRHLCQPPWLHPGIGIRCEGDRLFAETTGSDWCAIEDWPNAQTWGQSFHPIDVFFPPVPVELLPESDTQFFERLSGVPMTFTRDTRGKVTSLVLHYRGHTFVYDKISDVPPQAPEPVKPPVIVSLDTNVLDASVGCYEVAPGAAFPKGLKVKVWREGAQLRFTKNDQGQVTTLTHHYTGATLAWFPDWEAKKVPAGTIKEEGR